MTRPAALLRAAHPEPSAAVTLVGVGLGAAAGLPASRVVLLGVAVALGQLSIGWANDWVDADRDAAAGRADKPVARGEVPARVVGAAAGAALLGCAVASLALGVVPGVVHLVAVGCGWAYDLGVKGTAASVLPYAVAFGLLPAVATTALPDAPWPVAWAVAAAALLGAGGHFANALPDLAADARTGVRGLPQRLGPTRSRWAAAGLLGLGAVAVALGPGVTPGGLFATAVAGVLVAGVVLLGRAGRDRLAFRLVMALALVALAGFLLRGAPLTA